MRTLSRLLGSLLASALALGSARSARGQTPPPEVVALFEEATAELAAKRFETACPKLERVVERVPAGMGAKLALGDCYLGAGRLASAQRAYVGAEAAAAAAGNATRQGEARLKAEAVTPRLGRLLVELAPEVRDLPGFTITRDGTPLSPAELGVAVALDAGEHVVFVSAAGRAPREVRVQVVDGASAVARIDALELAPEPSSSPSGAASRGAPRADDDALGGQAIAGIVLGGVGVGGLAAAGLFTGLASSALTESNELGCTAGTDTCSTVAGFERREHALTLAHVATGTLAGGAALLATGAIVFFTAPSEPVAVALVPGGFVVGGRF